LRDFLISFIEQLKVISTFENKTEVFMRHVYVFDTVKHELSLSSTGEAEVSD